MAGGGGPAPGTRRRREGREAAAMEVALMPPEKAVAGRPSANPVTVNTGPNSAVVEAPLPAAARSAAMAENSQEARAPPVTAPRRLMHKLTDPTGKAAHAPPPPAPALVLHACEIESSEAQSNPREAGRGVGVGIQGVRA